MSAPDDGAAAALARHATALATVRDFGRRAQAERVVLLVDLGDGEEAAMVEWRAGAPLDHRGVIAVAEVDEKHDALGPRALAEVAHGRDRRRVPGERGGDVVVGGHRRMVARAALTG